MQTGPETLPDANCRAADCPAGQTFCPANGFGVAGCTDLLNDYLYVQSIPTSTCKLTRHRSRDLTMHLHGIRVYRLHLRVKRGRLCDLRALHVVEYPFQQLARPGLEASDCGASVRWHFVVAALLSTVPQEANLNIMSMFGPDIQECLPPSALLMLFLASVISPKKDCAFVAEIADTVGMNATTEATHASVDHVVRPLCNMHGTFVSMICT